MKLSLYAIFLVFGILLKNDESLGSRRYDSMRSLALGLTSSLDASKKLRFIQSAFRPRRRRETLYTSEIQRMVDRMCGIVSRLDASQWWAAVMKCEPISVHPPAYPGLIRDAGKCVMQVFGSINNYWEYQKICDFDEKMQDPRNSEVWKCGERWMEDNMPGLLMHAVEQRRNYPRCSVPRIDQDIMRQCLANTDEFVDASDELMDDVANLLKTNFDNILKFNWTHAQPFR